MPRIIFIPITTIIMGIPMMHDLLSILTTPFTDFAFMRRALTACIILAVGAAPLGFFMNQRRMGLAADAMSHAIFPGVAIAFLLDGLKVWALTLGGLAAGIVIVLFAVFLGRFTRLKEDSSFTMIFLLSLTSGLVILSLKGSQIDLLHLLFGDILAIDDAAMIFIAAASILTLVGLATIYRGLMLDCFDPDFLMASGRGRWIRPLFFTLCVINLVAAFQALGTLMALGLMLLPAIASGFWTRRADLAIVCGGGIAVAASYIGLLVSYSTGTPSGPVIVLTCGLLCLVSVLFGRYGSLLAGLRHC